MTLGLLASLLAGCSGASPQLAAPPTPPDTPFVALSDYAPDPAISDEIHRAYVISQGLSCALLSNASQTVGLGVGGSRCGETNLPMPVLIAQTCEDLPPGYDLPPTLDELEVMAVEQLNTVGQASPLEAVEGARALISGGYAADVMQAYLMFQYTREAIGRWDAADALSCATQGEALSHELGLELLAAQFIEAQAFAHVRAQRYGQSKERYSQARIAYAALEDPYYLRRLEGNHSAHHDRREFRRDKARWGAEQALAAFIATEDVPRAGRALIKQAINAYHDQDLDEAEQLARIGVSFGRVTQEPWIEGEALIALGHTLTERGDMLGASAAYREAMTRFSPQGQGRLHWLNAFSSMTTIELRALSSIPEAQERRAGLEELDGKVTRAEAFLADLSPEQWVELKLNHARIKLELSHIADATSLMSLAHAKVEADDLSLWRVPVLLLRADIAATAGDRGAAMRAYQEAERDGVAADDLTQQWTAILGQASLCQQAGERQEALAQLGRAAQVVERLWMKVADSASQRSSAGSGSATFLESQIQLYDRAVETLLEGEPTHSDQLLAWWWLERRRSNELRVQLGNGDGPKKPNAQAANWLRRVQARLGEASSGHPEAILEYHVSRNASYVFLITKDSFRVRPLPLNGGDLGAAIDRAFPFLGVTGSDLPVAGERANALAAALLSPVAEHLREGVVLRIIPDGRLTVVPFEILRLNGQPLINRHPVAYDTSATSLLQGAQGADTTARGVLSVAVGNSLAAEEDRGSLPQLPCATGESRRLTTSPEDLSLRDSKATEAGFRQQAPHFDILHIAAHGVVEEGSWGRSHLALQPGGGHDGRLSLREIAGLRLAARLAVLPACRSAVAHIYRGEGIQGFGSAFRQAGVPSTVVGLWELPDVQGTSEIVTRMVTYVRRGLGPAEALQRAKLDVMNAGADPRIWGPLVLYGSVEPLIRRPGLGEGLRLPPPTGEMKAACQSQPVRDLFGDVLHRLSVLVSQAAPG